MNRISTDDVRSGLHQDIWGNWMVLLPFQYLVTKTKVYNVWENGVSSLTCYVYNVSETQHSSR